MSLVQKFEKLMSHLNGEDNDMAQDFAQALQFAEERLERLAALEAGGVDNWSGYGDCFEGEDDE